MRINSQILAGTKIDSHGERFTLQDLKDFCEKLPPRIPLNRMHDLSLSPAGYAENFQVVPDPTNNNEWFLVGDVFADAQDVSGLLEGFSISITTPLLVRESAELKIALPYPHYNDPQLIENLSKSPNLEILRWRKKAADPEAWALVSLTLLIFILTPAWERLFDTAIAPILKDFFEAHGPTLEKRGIKTELVLFIVENENPIELLLIPDRQGVQVEPHSQAARAAIEVCKSYLSSLGRVDAIQVSKIVMCFDRIGRRFEIARVELSNGQLMKL